jgi:hypothetical protein
MVMGMHVQCSLQVLQRPVLTVRTGVLHDLKIRRNLKRKTTI